MSPLVAAMYLFIGGSDICAHCWLCYMCPLVAVICVPISGCVFVGWDVILVTVLYAGLEAVIYTSLS